MPYTRYLPPAFTAILVLLLAGQLAYAQGGPRRSGEPDDRMSRHAERFISVYDTGGDGKVSMKEIAAEQKRLFGAVDVDGDGKLSVSEFRRRGRLLQALGTTTLFDLLDANGDRNVTAAEVAAPSGRWFKRYDTNGDGVMTAEELPDRGWRRFHRRSRR